MNPSAAQENLCGGYIFGALRLRFGRIGGIIDADI